MDGVGKCHQTQLRNALSEFPLPAHEPTDESGGAESCSDTASGWEQEEEEGAFVRYMNTSFPLQHTSGEKTTLLVRNVPVKYTLDLLLRDLRNESGIDMVYLPYNSVFHHNRSYAFLNFSSEVAASEFIGRRHKRRFPRFFSKKSLSISDAVVQGLHANLFLQSQMRSTCRTFQCHVAVFSSGERVPPNDLLHFLQHFGEPL